MSFEIFVFPFVIIYSVYFLGVGVNFIRTIFYNVVQYNKIIFKIYSLIGIVFHELSHLLFAVVLRREVVDIQLFADERDAYSGHIDYISKPGLLNRFIDYLIAIAPVIMGTVTIALLTNVMSDNTLVMSISDIVSLLTYNTQLNVDVIKDLFATTMITSIELIDIVLLLFFHMIGLNMSMSLQDVKNSINGSIIFYIVFTILLVILNLIDYQLVLLTYRMGLYIISTYLIVFIILLSISMTFIITTFMIQVVKSLLSR